MASRSRHESSREPKRMLSSKGPVRRTSRKDWLERLSKFSPGQIRAIAEFERVSCTFLIQLAAMLALLCLVSHWSGRYELALATTCGAILGLRFGRWQDHPRG